MTYSGRYSAGSYLYDKGLYGSSPYIRDSTSPYRTGISYSGGIPSSGYLSKSSSTNSINSLGSGTSSGSRYSSRYSSTDTPSTDRYASTTGRSASSDRPSSYAGYSRQPVTSTSEKDFKKWASTPDLEESSLPTRKQNLFKQLYEEEKTEHEKSKEELKATQRELRETKLELDRIRRGERMATESVSDRRERRQLERKLSEMEEEVKLMEQLKQDNQRLKEENGALIRVISKLSK